jgi:acyl carrier protein
MTSVNVDEELKAIVAKKAKQDFGAATTLAEAGLDSLDVIEIAFDIEDKFQIELPQTQHEMITFTYGDLCRLVEEKVAAKADGAPSAPVNAWSR